MKNIIIFIIIFLSGYGISNASTLYYIPGTGGYGTTGCNSIYKTDLSSTSGSGTLFYSGGFRNVSASGDGLYLFYAKCSNGFIYKGQISGGTVGSEIQITSQYSYDFIMSSTYDYIYYSGPGLYIYKLSTTLGVSNGTSLGQQGYVSAADSSYLLYVNNGAGGGYGANYYRKSVNDTSVGSSYGQAGANIRPLAFGGYKGGFSPDFYYITYTCSNIGTSPISYDIYRKVWNDTSNNCGTKMSTNPGGVYEFTAPFYSSDGTIIYYSSSPNLMKKSSTTTDNGNVVFNGGFGAASGLRGNLSIVGDVPVSSFCGTGTTMSAGYNYFPNYFTGQVATVQDNVKALFSNSGGYLYYEELINNGLSYTGILNGLYPNTAFTSSGYTFSNYNGNTFNLIISGTGNVYTSSGVYPTLSGAVDYIYITGNPIYYSVESFNISYIGILPDGTTTAVNDSTLYYFGQYVRLKYPTKNIQLTFKNNFYSYNIGFIEVGYYTKSTTSSYSCITLGQTYYESVSGQNFTGSVVVNGIYDTGSNLVLQDGIISTIKNIPIVGSVAGIISDTISGAFNQLIENIGLKKFLNFILPFIPPQPQLKYDIPILSMSTGKLTVSVESKTFSKYSTSLDISPFGQSKIQNFTFSIFGLVVWFSFIALTLFLFAAIPYYFMQLVKSITDMFLALQTRDAEGAPEGVMSLITYISFLTSYGLLLGYVIYIFQGGIGELLTGIRTMIQMFLTIFLIQFGDYGQFAGFVNYLVGLILTITVSYGLRIIWAKFGHIT